MNFNIEIAKKAFMIIDKDLHHKRRNYYNIFMFKVEHDDYEHGNLSYVKKPIFQGMVEFEQIGLDTEGDEFEAFRFWKRIKPPNIRDLKNDLERNLTPVNPRIFAKMFKHAKFIVIPADQMDEENAEIIYEFAEKYQVTDRIRRYNLCNHCKRKRELSLLSKNEIYTGLNKKLICKECAGKEIYRSLKNDYEMDISPQLKILMIRKLLRFKSVPKVISMFQSNFNPLQNPDMTIYDKKSATKDLIDKIASIGTKKIKNLPLPDVLKNYYTRNGIKELLPIQTIAVNQGLFKNENLLVVSSTSSGKTLLGELSGFSKILQQKMKKHPLSTDLSGLPKSKRNEVFNAYYKSLTKVRPNGRMLYLVPIVALASLRFEEYKDLKRIGIKAGLKVGKSFMDTDMQKEFGLMKKSDVIVGTYEAIDVILRSGGKNSIGNVDTIVIDEIQMLNDTERGWVLDGMISRLRFVYPKAQFLFLSATISDPKMLAKHYKCNLIEFKGRPVPMERHLIMSLSDFEKQRSLLLLTDSVFKEKSSFGFKGQSLVFTNSRKKCHSIAEFLSNNGVSAAAYHGGLTLVERRKIEYMFSKQFTSTVVTTAALAAGVDFPASQVIFESLSMGIKWLSVAEFEQMSGRAGRYKKHDKAKVVVLCEPGKTYHSGQLDTEEKIAVRILNGKIESIKLDPDQDKMFTELLAFISMCSEYTTDVNQGNTDNKDGFENEKPKDLIYEYYEKMKSKGKINKKTQNRKKSCAIKREIIQFQDFMLNNEYNLTSALNYLRKQQMINTGKLRPNGVPEIGVTAYGKSCAESFYSIEKCIKIKDSLVQNVNLLDLNDDVFSGKTNEEDYDEDYEESEKDDTKSINPNKKNMFEDNLPVMIALEINPFKNIYVSNSVVKELHQKSNSGKGSSLLFSNSTLSLLSADNLSKKNKISRFMKDLMMLWTKEIFNCDCADSPYCNCGRRNVETKIIELKLKGKNLYEITKFLNRRWQLKVYMGDLIDYFDGFMHNLRSIYKIGRTLKLDEDVAEYIQKLPDLIKLIRT